MVDADLGHTPCQERSPNLLHPLAHPSPGGGTACLLPRS